MDVTKTLYVYSEGQSLGILKHRPTFDFHKNDFMFMIIQMDDEKIVTCRGMIQSTHVPEEEEAVPQKKFTSHHLHEDYINMAFTLDDPRLFDLVTYLESSYRFFKETNKNSASLIKTMKGYFDQPGNDMEVFQEFIVVAVCSAAFALKLSSMDENETGKPFAPFDIPKSSGTFDTNLGEINPDVHLVTRSSLDLFNYYTEVSMNMGHVSPGLNLLWFTSMLKKHFHQFITPGTAVQSDECARDRSMLTFFMSVKDKCEFLLAETARVHCKIPKEPKVREIISNTDKRFREDLIRCIDKRVAEIEQRLIESVNYCKQLEERFLGELSGEYPHH